jgi:cob(I)alamin adenosyltransferase
MKIYTKTGDQGTTGLFGGGRVKKHHERIEAYGTVDETNSFVGLARSYMRAETRLSVLDNYLEQIQHQLFTLGADLASPPESKANIERLTEHPITWLEECIDSFEEDLEPLRNFILPAGPPAAASLHCARTVCRRAERTVTRLHDDTTGTAIPLKYLNRLSDFLFVATRWAGHQLGESEHVWKSGERD